MNKKKIVEERCSNSATVEKKDVRKYIQYRATLSAIKSLKCIIDDEPIIEAVPIEQMDYITNKAIAEYLRWRD